MGNNLLRDKTSPIEYILATCVMTALLFFTNITNINLGHYSLDGLLGWAMIVAFGGMSTYKSAIPGFLIGIVWGLMGGNEPHIAANIVAVFSGMLIYQMLSHLRPMSPLNVYEAAISGSVMHSVLIYATGVHRCDSLLVFILLELIIALATFKVAINKVREMGFINHEDPVLVARIERDWVQELYNKINKLFRTNFQRPKKPGCPK